MTLLNAPEVGRPFKYNNPYNPNPNLKKVRENAARAAIGH